MRDLIFDVVQQRLKRNDDCDFSGIVAGSEGYLRAKFNFLDSSWDGCKKIAGFSAPYVEDIGVVLDDDNSCMIPAEVTHSEEFGVVLIGAKPDYKIPTNFLRIRQEADYHGNN